MFMYVYIYIHYTYIYIYVSILYIYIYIYICVSIYIYIFKLKHVQSDSTCIFTYMHAHTYMSAYVHITNVQNKTSYEAPSFHTSGTPIPNFDLQPIYIYIYIYMYSIRLRCRYYIYICYTILLIMYIIFKHARSVIIHVCNPMLFPPLPAPQGPTEPALGILTALCRNCLERQDRRSSPKMPA